MARGARRDQVPGLHEAGGAPAAHEWRGGRGGSATQHPEHPAGPGEGGREARETGRAGQDGQGWVPNTLLELVRDRGVRNRLKGQGSRVGAKEEGGRRYRKGMGGSGWEGLSNMFLAAWLFVACFWELEAQQPGLWQAAMLGSVSPSLSCTTCSACEAGAAGEICLYRRYLGLAATMLRVPGRRS